MGTNRSFVPVVSSETLGITHFLFAFPLYNIVEVCG